MASVVLDSVNSHIVVGGVTVAFIHYSFCISLCPQQEPRPVVVLYLVRQPKPSFWVWPLIVLPELGSCYFPLSLMMGHGDTKDTLRDPIYSRHILYYLHCEGAVQFPPGSQDQDPSYQPIP